MNDIFGYCGCTDYSLLAAEEAMARWGRTSLTWTITGLLPGYNRDKLREMYAAAWQSWIDVCGIRANYTDGPADVNMGSGTIDGANGTLAWSELPPGDDRPLKQKYDTAERWDDVMVLAVASHELGHALGLGHLSAGNLLQPYYSRSITKPQVGDIAEVVRRYGQPLPKPSPSDPPDPPAGEITIQIAGASPTVEATGTAALTLRVPRVDGLKIRIPGYKVVPE